MWIEKDLKIGPRLKNVSQFTVELNQSFILGRLETHSIYLRKTVLQICTAITLESDLKLTDLPTSGMPFLPFNYLCCT